MGERMEDFENESATWIASQPVVELEIGCLIAAASDWTEDETELDDLVTGLIDSGRIDLQIG